jgi:hypothetical protein
MDLHGSFLSAARQRASVKAANCGSGGFDLVFHLKTVGGLGIGKIIVSQPAKECIALAKG